MLRTIDYLIKEIIYIYSLHTRCYQAVGTIKKKMNLYR